MSHHAAPRRKRNRKPPRAKLGPVSRVLVGTATVLMFGLILYSGAVTRVPITQVPARVLGADRLPEIQAQLAALPHTEVFVSGPQPSSAPPLIVFGMEHGSGGEAMRADTSDSYWTVLRASAVLVDTFGVKRIAMEGGPSDERFRRPWLARLLSPSADCSRILAHRDHLAATLASWRHVEGSLSDILVACLPETVVITGTEDPRLLDEVAELATSREPFSPVVLRILAAGGATVELDETTGRPAGIVLQAGERYTAAEATSAIGRYLRYWTKLLDEVDPRRDRYFAELDADVLVLGAAHADRLARQAEALGRPVVVVAHAGLSGRYAADRDAFQGRLAMLKELSMVLTGARDAGQLHRGEAP
ncbi:MAG: hypothetical protein HYV63_26765 [Candidatus Schekmanbacteria bacterium]|nr:hypothetical protein [Candidatus Schekmanbacteria bacterium]